MTYTDCLTPEQAKDPVKALSALKDLGSLIGRQCKTLQVNQDANTDRARLSPAATRRRTYIAIDLAFSFLDARHYTGTVKSTFVFKGKKTTSDKAIDAKWLEPPNARRNSAQRPNSHSTQAEQHAQDRAKSRSGNRKWCVRA